MRLSLNWILALVLALGPASLQSMHAACAHRDCAASSEIHHDHDEAGQPSEVDPHGKRHQDGCGICDELTALSSDMPASVAVPVGAPRAEPSAPQRADAPDRALPPRICRGQPPPLR